MSGAIYLPAQRPMNSKADPPDRNPHSTQRSEPPREKGEPLTCSPYKRSGDSLGFSSPGPAFSLQREYLSVVMNREYLSVVTGGTSWR